MDAFSTLFVIFMEYLKTMESGNSSNICVQIYPSLFMFLIGNPTILDELIHVSLEVHIFYVILESSLQTIKVTRHHALSSEDISQL